MNVKVVVNKIEDNTFIQSAKRAIDIEAKAVSLLYGRIDESFSKACDIILNSRGRVIVIGMGKSGHIANKIAATLASTGTPAFFVHPGEANHGDLGMITGNDVVLALSNSGETKEIITLLPLIKRMGAQLISFSGEGDSALSQAAVVNLDVSVDQEACPLGLAPTSSTTVALVMGDALAIALLEARGFSEEDFAFSHPGGSLGRRLLLKVEDIMHTGDSIPIVNKDTMLSVALLEMTRKGLGMTTVLDQQGKLLGIFTDGDLRRTIDDNIDIHATAIDKVMTRDCCTLLPGLLVAEALRMMEDKMINAIIVVDQDQKPVGALNMHDLLRHGVL